MKQIIRRIAALVIGLGLGATALAGLESVTHISDLNSAWPLGSDLASTSDDHIRNIKVALKTDFPNITGPVTVTQAQLNAVGASGITGAANPSASLGLSAINGTATSFMRSDAAPALSQAIVPTMTGAWAFTPSGAVTAVTINGAANQDSFVVNGVVTSGQSFGPRIKAGTTSADWAVNITNQAGRAYLFIKGDGTTNFGNTTDNPAYNFLGTGTLTTTSFKATSTAVQGLGPVAAALVDMTPDTGTFTGTFTGFTAGVTGTCTWTRVGKLVTLVFPVVSGTSNASTFTMTGLPAAIQPASLTQTMVFAAATSNGIFTGPNLATVTTASGTVTFYVNGSGTPTTTGWGATGTKGLPLANAISYLLN